MSDLARSVKDRYENEGLRWRRELKLYAYDPLPAHLLSQHLKVQILSPMQIPDVDEQLIQCLLAEDAGWSALAMPLPLESIKHLIIYNPTHAATRHESDVMHELAHVLLGHQPIRFRQLVGGLFMREYRPVDEKAAEYLGGCLQITARGLDWAIQRSMTQREAAEHFGASLPMVRFRCNMTGRKFDGS